MFFFLQSWEEVTVRIFVRKTQYFWSQTSLIAPKESMMGTKSRAQGSDGPGRLPLYTLWRCAVKPLLGKPYAHSMCLLYIEQNVCTSSVHIFTGSKLALFFHCQWGWYHHQLEWKQIVKGGQKANKDLTYLLLCRAWQHINSYIAGP